MEFRPFTVTLATTFRGTTERAGVLLSTRDERGEHWGEYSPFPDYDAERASRWWRAAVEAAHGRWPTPVRTHVAVNSIVPEVGLEQAFMMASAGGATTAKVKVTDGGAADAARVEAAASAMGPDGRVRIDVNGAWDVDHAVRAIRHLDRAARAGGTNGLEYVEQPCATVAELAELRRRVNTPIAADESVRLPGEVTAVLAADAADVIILKVAPMGGVLRCLDIADQVGDMPIVVSSAMESSVGLAAGIALACAMPREPLACGLGTGALLATDTVRHTVVPVGGMLAPVVFTGDRAVEVTA